MLTYDALDALDRSREAVSIDMAGNPAVLSAIHHRLGDRLKYSMTVGRSHHDAAAPAAEAMAGPKPETFFAPTVVRRRRQEWGRAKFERRAADALAGFVEGSRSWLGVEHRAGPEATASAWTDVYNGSIAPNVGLVATLQA